MGRSIAVARNRYQAAKIRELTNGIIRAEVTTTTGHEDFVVHRLELVAPQLDNRRYGVLSATHRTDIYPVVLEADCFRPAGPYAGALLDALGAHPDHAERRYLLPVFQQQRAQSIFKHLVNKLIQP